MIAGFDNTAGGDPPSSRPNKRRSSTGLAAASLAAVLILSAVAPSTAYAQDQLVPGRLLVKFRNGTPPAAARAAIQAAGASLVDVIPGIDVKVLQLPPNANERAQAAAFANRPEVQFAEPDWIYSLQQTTIPNDPQYSNQWHLPQINAPAAWTATTGSSDIIIAILDTGVDPTHPDLAPKLVPGWNFYDGNANTADVHGHGTAVAGTAAAIGNNGAGVASVAWQCRIMPLRIAGPDGWASTVNMGRALVWSADRYARVANISFAASTSSTVRTAAEYFQNAGGVVCVSAGNQGLVLTAQDNPFLLTVSATGSNDAIASFSNSGPLIDIAAPGVGIRTTTRGGGYGNWSGTSFSAPVVAGVAALVISANPQLSGAQVQQVLMNSAADLGATGWDPVFGWGRVDAGAAVAAANGGSSPPGGGPPPDTTPPTITITSPGSGSTVSGNLPVTVYATDDVGVTRVELLVNGQLAGSSTSAPFTIRWNTRRGNNGVNTLQCIAYDAANNVGASSVVTVQR